MFRVNFKFESFSHVFLAFLFLTLNMYLLARKKLYTFLTLDPWSSMDILTL